MAYSTKKIKGVSVVKQGRESVIVVKWGVGGVFHPEVFQQILPLHVRIYSHMKLVDWFYIQKCLSVSDMVGLYTGGGAYIRRFTV
jgi:hypothetical protein